MLSASRYGESGVSAHVLTSPRGSHDPPEVTSEMLASRGDTGLSFPSRCDRVLPMLALIKDRC